RKADASRPRVSGGTKPVSVRAIRTEQELAAFAPQWRALFNAANCRLPFVHFSWIEQWWRAFGGSLPLRRNELAILIAEDAGRPVGILPLYRTTYGVASGFGMRYVRPLGSDANLTEVRTALMLPGYESAVLAAVEGFFTRQADEWDLINWGSYPVPFSPGANVPGHCLSVDRHDPVEMFV